MVIFKGVLTMHALQDFEKAQLKQNLPPFKAGDTVKVHCKIKEGDKERIQIFEGVVLSRHNAGVSSSFTVRKISYGIGVERVFPLHAPFIDRIDVITRGKVRQSRIYYLRKLFGKKARITAMGRKLGEDRAPVVPEEGKVEGPEMEAPDLSTEAQGAEEEVPSTKEKPNTDKPETGEAETKS